MNRILPTLSVLVLSCIGCTNYPYNSNQNTHGSTDTLSNHSVETGSIANSPIYADSMLLPFRVVVDTLNSAEDVHVHSEYFLHDISGNGQPELWIISGGCEADKELWVYQVTDGSVRKIFSEYGGHTEFFLRGNQIGSLTCNTGSGYVSAYTYKNGKIFVETVEYDGWNEKELVKVKNTRDRSIADIWEKSDSTINLMPLK